MTFTRAGWHPASPPRGRGWRGYDRQYAAPLDDWTYEEAPPRPPGPPGFVSPPIVWDGLPINPGWGEQDSTFIVENVEGWLDSPPNDGHDHDRALADGAAWGPKVLQARIITITGAAVGPRPLLGWYRDQLAMRAAARVPAELAITDGGLERTLTAQVRAGTDSYKQTWITPTAFRWSVVLTAADPVLYAAEWQTAVLTQASGASGRQYPRGEPGRHPGQVSEEDGSVYTSYPWQYGLPFTPNSANLANAGNTAATVYALYEGEMTQSRLTDDAGGLINLAPLVTGMQVLVESATLTAETTGGISRAAAILPGSRPMAIPPMSSSRWHSYFAGPGQITLAWRSAWV